MYQKRLYYICMVLGFLYFLKCAQTQERAKDNGDIYVVNVTKLMKADKMGNSSSSSNNITSSSSSSNNITNSTIASNISDIVRSSSSSTEAFNENTIDFDAVMNLCNSSFSIPMDYVVQFNNTGALPDIIDKTGMCYLRCFYEKSGLIDNWKLNADKIRQNIWPATGDSIEYCEQQGKKEINACVRTYAIANCLMIRSIVDARNKPI